MRALLFTTGSPFARAVRIVLDELSLDYERREEITTPSAEQRAQATPTLQVPTFWDGDLVLWESGTIAEYLLSTYPDRPQAAPKLAPFAFRPGDAQWQDKLVFSTIQTFGNAATTISQMKWSGVSVGQNTHLQRSAEKLAHILGWLEDRLSGEDGFVPGYLSMKDIFLAAHVRFVQARPLGVDLKLDRYGKVSALLDRLDARGSFKANPIWWWEPGVIGYEPDGTPVYEKQNA
ncbi:glutathione S-transferase family protein [Ruegeria sp. THAF33]|uniref:glutathione S-transferase family protein n=1 Tax=Ruegeria sp. THAF33 TaxID=2587853 RepID=UPI001268D5DB|nr:glutathione S-transferase family protein [Ruegeria sp. THAF33]QFT74401.1 stringent starvation protein A [Ruegeria sp. THAF33]